MFHFFLILVLTSWLDRTAFKPLLALPTLPVGAEGAARIALPIAEDRTMQVPRRVTASVGVVTTATAVVVTDAKTGVPLYEKNADEPLPLASITKLMTALVVLDANPKWDERIKMISDDFAPGGNDRLHPGDELTVRDLFGLSLVASENNATRALMRAAHMTQDQFVAAMNTRARALGLQTANFMEPTGLDEANRASAKDVAWLARAAFARDEIRKLVSSGETRFVVSGAAKYAPSTDDLLRTFLNKDPYHITGGKTGSLDSHQYNLALQIKYDDASEAIVVVLGSASDESRFQDAKGLTVWIFNNFSWR